METKNSLFKPNDSNWDFVYLRQRCVETALTKGLGCLDTLAFAKQIEHYTITGETPDDK